ncbi:carboxylic acid reductase [Nocardia iowensis]|uniref:Carboxylic acid reductase n=1 Tax=Nocardia iowensis TaxID=204891 RepID=A0ABX8REM5_NOCIO|nr:carboxylic acid reductase [Nocardia iowensis]QXN88057.1 thioester reductase domain-containing protein [Nocardia iowensis]
MDDNETLQRRIEELIAQDEQVAAAVPSTEVMAAVDRDGLAFAGMLEMIIEGYGDRPALGQRGVGYVTDDSGRSRTRLLPRYDTISYRQLWQRIGAVASAWYHDPEFPLRAGDFVAVLGFASVDYATVDLACGYLGTVSVPLQAGSAEAALSAIVAETEPRMLATSAEELAVAMRLARAAESICRVVVFDYDDRDDDHRDALRAARNGQGDKPVRVDTLDELLARGRELPVAPARTEADPNELALIIYTSGSTGAPKGAIYTDRLVSKLWRAGCRRPVPTVQLNYMPMSHVAARMLMGAALIRGGTLYFAARSDMSTLLEDLALVRPTSQFLVPRVCDLIFQHYRSELARAGSETQVKTALREHLLGGRVIHAGTSSAPIAAEMKDFIESVLDIPLHDNFGTTETGPDVILDTVVQHPPVLDYKLVDVPELGYFRTDRPYPRGELLVKVDTQIPGYYKRPELNEQIFDADGYYRTGDVMAELAPDRLVYLDRSKNVLKLSQGEFVAVSKLDALYISSPLVRQIYVYGSSVRSYLLAVVVPTADACAAHPDAAELKAAVLASLQQVGQQAALSSYEIPRDILLETEPFSIENGMLSGIGKSLRPKLKQRYDERLEQLYADIEHQQQSQLATLRHEGRELPAAQAVGRAVQVVLGCAATDLRPDAHFTDLGGDSLSALSLSNLLGEIFQLGVPVGVIVSPATTLQGLADYIQAQQSSMKPAPTAASVHGSELRAADLTLDKFIDADTLAATTTPRVDSQPQTVLLTGANGYLGRFLCLEWLQRLHDSAGTLVCIVRGSDAAAARERLDGAFDSGDPELLRRYHELADGTLEVLPGDIGYPNLGLGEDDWRHLAGTADLIVHAAALVNHVLPYDQLFGPNVVGTAEIIRLALTERIKPVTYLSTVAVASQIDPQIFTENGHIREISPVRTLGDDYANGYGNSKWAGEVLLREANEHYGLPVTTFRSDMILAHSRYAGQLNVPDMFTRLLLSVLVTGLAPKSFYELDARGNRRRAHYDGLPADFTAAAITALGPQTTSGYQTFDVINPHDDGISLDTFVDWLIEAGHPIQCLDDYPTWLSRFTTALLALPERQRQHSIIPLLHAFQQPEAPLRGAALPAKEFQTAVQAAGLGPQRDIPHLSPALIEKYVADLRLLNLI